MTKVYGLDLETYDPELKDRGYSWKYGSGYILNVALYDEKEDKVDVIPGLHNGNTPYAEQERKRLNALVRGILEAPDCLVVGANLMYDIGWLIYEYGMGVYDVKCRFFDVLSAEACIDEFSRINLESVSWKYLRYGKRKGRIEQWVFDNVEGARGDFRKYLKEAPWDLLCEYVEGDACNPVNIMRKQLTVLKEQGLAARAKLDFDCLLPILMITVNGFPIDLERKHANLRVLRQMRDELRDDFVRKYGREVNVNSGKQLAAFFDAQGVPYNMKLTLKGEHGVSFAGYEQADDAMRRAKRLVSSFRFVKRIPVAYVPVEMSGRTEDLLTQQGFDFTSSPNIDKKFFSAQRENYPVVGMIADWRLANGILSKVLGDEFDRFVNVDKDGVTRVHAQYNVTKSDHGGTISSRLSSNAPNCQQLPSKGSLTVYAGTDREKSVSFPELTRALFTCEKGGVYFKIDYSQIEYRLIVHYAVGQGAEEARRLFNEDPKTDFHDYTVKLTGLSRKYAKNMSFGISFGMGIKSMAETFGWTLEHAQEIADQYHEHIPFVAPTLALVSDLAKERGYIRTILGNRARLRNPNLAYTMLNRLTQGGGADILKASVVRAYKEEVFKKLKIHVTVHDELGGTVMPSEEQVREVIKLEDIMENTVKLKIPLLAEAEFGMNWNDVKSPQEWLSMKGTPQWETLPEELRYVTETYARLKAT